MKASLILGEALAEINNNRNFIGIEMDEKYYKIAKKRCACDLPIGAEQATLFN